MAKKESAAAEKKRKGTTATAITAAEGQVLGTVSIPVFCNVSSGGGTNFDELVIEWGCLGLSEEPDSITEISGNARMLDPERPPTTSEEGLHVFFKPPLAGGTYGFQFHFTYNDAAQARTCQARARKTKQRRHNQCPEDTPGIG